MKAATHLQVSTPQGDAGELTQEQGQFLFGYGPASADAAVSLTMPVRKAQYAHASLHPIFQMNLPEGFLLEALQNRLAKSSIWSPCCCWPCPADKPPLAAWQCNLIL